MLRILRSRKFARRTLIALLIIIIPAFVLWGAGSISERPRPIGTIETNKILPQDFGESIQGMRIQLLLTYFGDYDKFENITGNRPVLNRLAWERLIFLHEAVKGKIKVADKDVISFLSSHPLFSRDGYFNKETYEHIIKNALRIEPREFEELVRQNLKVKTFLDALYREIVVDEDEIVLYYRKLNDKVNISFFLVDKDSFKSESGVSEDDIKKYYSENIQEFNIPAKTVIEYIEMSYANYEEREEVVKTIQEIYEKARKEPEKLEEIAKNYGIIYKKTDPLSQFDIIPGIRFSKEIYKIAFALRKGSVSKPVLTSEEAESGKAYILRKVDIIPAAALSYESARNIISKKLDDMRFNAAARGKADELYKKLASGDTTLKKAAKEINANVETAENLTLYSYIEKIGPAKDIIEKSVNPGPNNMLEPISSTRGILLVKIESVSKAPKEAYTEERAKLFEEILTQKKIEIQEKWFAEKAPKSSLFISLDLV